VVLVVAETGRRWCWRGEREGGKIGVLCDGSASIYVLYCVSCITRVEIRAVPEEI